MSDHGGAVVYDLVEAIQGRTPPEDCDWHEELGIPYLTSAGICGGPACRAYFDEHLDALDDDGGMGEL